MSNNTRQRTWKQECQIAEGRDMIKPKPVIGYEFTGRKFKDKVDKNRSYD